MSGTVSSWGMMTSQGTYLHKMFLLYHRTWKFEKKISKWVVIIYKGVHWVAKIYSTPTAWKPNYTENCDTLFNC